MKDEIFSVFGALGDLNERLKAVEKQTSNYNADMLEVGRRVGELHKKLMELEKKLDKLL